MNISHLDGNIAKALIDKSFLLSWYNNFVNVSNDLQIPQEERQLAHDLLNELVDLYGSDNSNSFPEILYKILIKYNSSKSKEIPIENLSEQDDMQINKHTNRVQDLAFSTLQNTMESAKQTYGRISVMSYIIFGIGISLFIASFITGISNPKEPLVTGILGALGIANFVTYFIFRPIQNIQKALSNLLQAEIIYMNFWDQIHFWAPYGGSNKIEITREGSERLNNLTKETLKMLQDYLESSNHKKGSHAFK